MKKKNNKKGILSVTLSGEEWMAVFWLFTQGILSIKANTGWEWPNDFDKEEINAYYKMIRQIVKKL